jgi:glutamyl-tRNA reductase
MDVVVSSVGGGDIIVNKDMVQSVIRRRKYKPLVFIDLSVPRVFDAALHDLDDVYLFDVDDLKGLTDQGESLRRSEAVLVEQMVQDSAQDCWRLLHADQHNRTIGQVFQNASTLCSKEVERLKSQASFSDEQLQVVQRSLESLVRKIYHHPVQYVHTLAQEGKNNEIQSVMNILLGSISPEEDDA